MAKAPRPGAGKRAAAADAAGKVMSISLNGGPPLHLAIGLIPIKEKMAVLAATGKPYEAFVDPISELTLVLWWWLARRANGEVLLAWQTAMDEWPTGMDVTDPDQILIEVDDPAGDAEDPEA